MSKRTNGNIQKLSEGKYRLRISCGFDDYGKRVQVTKVVYCKSEREAEKMLMDLYSEREKLIKERGNGAPQTLEQLYGEWNKNHVSKLAVSTQIFYSNYWNNYIKKYGSIKLSTLKAKHIYDIINSVDSARNKNAVYKMLKSMLHKAKSWEYIATNSCDNVETPKYKAQEKQTLTEEDIERIIPLIANEKLKFQAMFYFAVLCGLRRQEILALNWSDIDFTNDAFKITKAATVASGKGTYTKETKTKKSERTLHLPQILKITLLKLQNEQNIKRHKMGDLWHDENWVFAQSNGKIMDLHTPTSRWSDFVKTHDLTPITFHDLRHTAATYMISHNVPISTVSAVLGHANITTTLNTYTHVVENTKEEAIKVMENMFAKDKKEQTCDTKCDTEPKSEVV